eukprot:COSAG01_NODE_5867_length_3982_cov_7.929178_3_plen_92_part_00
METPGQDNPRSLAIKSAYAERVGAGGVGMWTSDLIDYNDSAMVEGFWGAFRPFTKPNLSSSPANLQLHDPGSTAPPAPRSASYWRAVHALP